MIWKCNNNDIRAGLLAAHALHDFDGFDRPVYDDALYLNESRTLHLFRERARAVIFHEHREALLKILEAGSFCSASTTTFTFVREPLQHFISGYAEFCYRTYTSKVEPEQTFKILTTVLRGETALLGGAVQHMYLMSGILANGWRLDQIGRLESFESDWAQIMKSSNIAPLSSVAAPRSLVHASSTDLQGARLSLRRLLWVRADLRLALCEMLRPDYVEFGYDFARCRSGQAI